jgi:hypothetical protein
VGRPGDNGIMNKSALSSIFLALSLPIALLTPVLA